MLMQYLLIPLLFVNACCYRQALHRRPSVLPTYSQINELLVRNPREVALSNTDSDFPDVGLELKNSNRPDKEKESNEERTSDIAEDDFDDDVYEKCEYDEHEEAPIFADKNDNTHYIACASYGLPVRLPCPPSTFFNPSLKSCVPDGFVDSLCGRSCVNGECVYDNSSNRHECKCYVGYTGRNCTEKIDYCETFGKNCGTGRCINQVGTYVCDCGYGMIGQSCDKPKPVPCQMTFVQEDGAKGRRIYHPFGTNQTSYITCFSEDSFIVRKCKDGQFWDQDYLACTNNRPETVHGECENYPCLHGGKCTPDELTGYSCNCTQYHYGRNCEYSIDHCNPNPCGGNKCTPSPDPPGYICECPNKIYDDCCCNDIENRCSASEQKFYAEKDNLFVHCTPDGRAFVKRCPDNFVFDEAQMTCVKPYKGHSSRKRGPKMRNKNGREREFSQRKMTYATKHQVFNPSQELSWHPEASNIPQDNQNKLKFGDYEHPKFSRKFTNTEIL